ncbi:MAG: hypothetical protein US30_C0004G0131 [Candidatus Moranbacteria bacterium GW2011_GWF2_36_839]|nr:MAG: hypothetical protein US27_C0002G0134 [Candidatus Moranbacteria bacterium GW2011_GWF1_36_78]KKQ17387.1 MAG: hypothetical protein US30_C0004G0131 [Candidatus Moranbacteria bacterium GW2011_GWF2_36_839]HAT73771.1 hypothetical protein [Candidatus Moranbacteria bacterium]HBY11086.1 hypothetical protein [Candidatus Moranbacteria bacterium]
MSNLKKLFKDLIAIEDGVKSEDVTPQYIHEQREKRIIPFIRYQDDPWLINLTQTEWQEIEKDLDGIMASFAH